MSKHLRWRPLLVFGLAGIAAWSTARGQGLPPVEDTLAQRLLACSACHGREGRAGPDGYLPRIAGKPPGYLYRQLKHFQQGRRRYGPMVWMVGTLSDAYLREIADHYAALDLPYPPPTRSEVPPALLARGRELARQGDAARQLPACTACHGEALTGVAPDVPGLLGLPRDYISGQIGAWRHGERRADAPDCMGQVAQRLGPDDVAAVAAWLSSQPVPVPSRAATRPPGAWPMECAVSGR